MEQIELGKSGVKTTRLGFGAMSFSNFNGPVTREQAFAIMDHARDDGLRHIDTSNVYGMGESEDHIGAYLRDRNAYQDFDIASKVGIARSADPDNPFNNSKAYIEAELDKSLKRLGVDHIALYYIHRRDPRLEIEEVTETMAGLVKSGKIGGIGYSEIAPWSLRRAQAVHPIAAVQSEYSLSTRTPELGMVQACRDLGVTFVAFSPVGRSLLTDYPKTAADIANQNWLRSNPRFMAPNLDINVNAAAGFRQLAADMGTSAAALAIAWCMAQGDHILPIPGTRHVSNFKELIEGANLKLSTADLAAIDAALPMGWVTGDRYSDAQWVGPERYA